MPEKMMGVQVSYPTSKLSHTPYPSYPISHMFNHTDAQSPWERQTNFGFRCVKLDSPPTPAAAAHLEVTVRDFWKVKPVSDDVFKAYAALYVYDKGALNEQVEETASMEISSREKVTFDAAYNGERVTAYLFLP